MMRIRTIGDGSCYIHAIIGAYCLPYIVGKYKGRPLDRRQFVRRLRHELSLILPDYYEKLSRGQLQQMSSDMPRYGLTAMQRLMNSNEALDNIFAEFVSDFLNKDIYVLDDATMDVYRSGYDSDILCKNRDSVVLLYVQNHYETVGLQTNKGIMTLFPPTHEFIEAIRKRSYYKAANK